ncbi:hypothetical protein ABL78_5554 [Leptomonas seymouri]|uniref:Cysteine dioxygenase n=1 Tax=Leptomonas seymouri TaxID=5684 RepID=A0A0N1I3C5_LEPSE|nr:hypothetical protein ABL78_5554 [Leptomonas seymouri]|eukprot:KPI85373.1 hypothetical protein ABL78_5554 [Leptomonas seymouri]
MKNLLRSLQHFSKTSTKHVELFGKLTLRDLGVYVSDADALKYMQDNDYPLGDKAFQLSHSIHQCRYDSETSRFIRHPWKSSPADSLGCSTLFESESVTLCWFVLPPGHALPLHDHPGMTVWQRVMHGRLHISTIVTRASPSTVKTAAATPATVLFDGVVDGREEAIPPSDIFTLGERDGSVLHEVRNVDAAMPALFVDIISPPYLQSPTNISCTYYQVEPARKEGQRLAGLPSDCSVHWKLKAGDDVLLHPRPDYAGPAMRPLVYVGGD